MRKTLLSCLLLANLLAACARAEDDAAAEAKKREAQLLATLKSLIEELDSGDKARQLKAVQALRPTAEELKLLLPPDPKYRAEAEKSLADAAKWYEANIADFASKFSAEMKKTGELKSIALHDIKARDPGMPKDLQIVKVTHTNANGSGKYQGEFCYVNGRWLWSLFWHPGR